MGVSVPWGVTADGVTLRIHLQPRAARDRIVGVHGDALKIALTAPPVDNAANTALLAFLATLCRVARSSVCLLGGGKSRVKRLLIRTTTPQEVIQRIEHALTRVDKKKRDD